MRNEEYWQCSSGILYVWTVNIIDTIGTTSAVYR